MMTKIIQIMMILPSISSTITFHLIITTNQLLLPTNLSYQTSSLHHPVDLIGIMLQESHNVDKAVTKQITEDT